MLSKALLSVAVSYAAKSTTTISFLIAPISSKSSCDEERLGAVK